jgi:hypothetical protein
MSRYRCLGVFVILIAGLIPMAANARPRNNPSYEGMVGFGAQQLYLQDGCLSVDGALTSGNFFADLRRSDLDGQSEFRKSGKLVTEYPESISTSIRVAGDPCSSAPGRTPSSVFIGDSYSLKFVVEWKDGMQLRPASVAPGVRCMASSLLTNSSKDVTIPAITCQMTIDSKGVPLANHLIVSVFSADGRRLTRLSAAP